MAEATLENPWYTRWIVIGPATLGNVQSRVFDFVPDWSHLIIGSPHLPRRFRGLRRLAAPEPSS
ncbi:hypothetical protein MES4922_210254 [Mesorhizobium ventifaucium]|uniref:Uncharacterized protein n=1 Tax=Mesorhizobium ventifaucium TaxID=666020 RepID=A0ABM9DRU8_9HYPH|nr:hypothetical protein MES4922_210254 [Mesorhizobium ventifaucium]